MAKMLAVEDYRQRARRKLPGHVYAYVDGGAETEATVQSNREAFRSVTLRPRGGVDPSHIDLTTTVLGRELSMPIMLAPCGSARIVHPGGDVAGARAARALSTAFCLSTMSGHSIEEVVEAANGAPVWYQVYRVGPRERVARAIARAEKAGVQALAITFDTAVVSLRERDQRNGGVRLLSGSKLRAAPHALKFLGKPRWLKDFVLDGMQPKLPNVLTEDGTPMIVGRGPTVAGLGWDDLPWIREIWGGPIVIKGLLTGEDAERAGDFGAAAIVVSNHGGRQLDTADATLRVLPEVVAAVNGRCEVLLDGGVRSGIDVMKAVGLGAKAVLVGRPWLYGLASNGQSGIESVLRILQEGMRRNMALLGVSRPVEIDRSLVRAPAEWFDPSSPRGDHLTYGNTR